MSKELPYFKFFSTEWLLGRISDKNFRTQGIFASACAHYWHKECTLTETELNQKLGKSRVKLLIDEKFLLQSNGKIIITFLDEQMSEFIDLKEKRSEAGRKGGQASVKQRLSKKEAKVNHLYKEIDKSKIREDKIRENHLFINSEFYDLQEFIIKIETNDKYLPFDCEYYHECLINWSAEGKMKKDWISTARTWMLRDVKDGKPKLKKEYEQKFKQNGKQSYEDKLSEYLNRKRDY